MGYTVATESEFCVSNRIGQAHPTMWAQPPVRPHDSPTGITLTRKRQVRVITSTPVCLSVDDRANDRRREHGADPRERSHPFDCQRARPTEWSYDRRQHECDGCTRRNRQGSKNGHQLSLSRRRIYRSKVRQVQAACQPVTVPAAASALPASLRSSRGVWPPWAPRRPSDPAPVSPSPVQRLPDSPRL